MQIQEEEIKDFKIVFDKIQNEIQNNIIGQKDIITNVLICIIAGGNVLLEGLPGLGKTQMVKAISRCIDLKFSRIQFTPDLMPSDITGTDIFVKKENEISEFSFQRGPIFSNIVLADEINRATPKTQSALLEAMQERTVTVGKSTYNLPEPFFVLATQNPIELEGTYSLPEAQLDRFMFKLNVNFPTKEELYEIVNLTTGATEVELKKVCDCEQIIKMREIAKKVPVAQAVGKYAVNLVFNTHPEQTQSPDFIKKYVKYGSSPRAAQALITAARINALIEGRFNVSFEDIKKMSYPSLTHRIFVNFEAVSEGISSKDIISKLLELKE